MADQRGGPAGEYNAGRAPARAAIHIDQKFAAENSAHKGNVDEHAAWQVGAGIFKMKKAVTDAAG